MKLVYMTDPHARSMAPISRNDSNFLETILNKLREVFDYARDNKADAVICGGDLFDTPQPSLNLILAIIKLLDEYNDTPFYVCAGNHDIYAHQMDTLDRTALGLLKEIDKVKLPDVLDIDGFKIKFFHYYHGAEEYLKMSGEIDDCDVLVNHAMVVENPFFGDHVIYKDVKQDYKVMLCSHYHPGFGYVKYKDKHIVAPGALTRTSIDMHNLTRVPSFAVIDMNGDSVKCKIIPLKSAKPAEEVFYIQKALQPTNVDYRDQLINSIDDLDLASCDVLTIVEEFCKVNNIDNRIKMEVLSRIG